MAALIVCLLSNARSGHSNMSVLQRWFYLLDINVSFCVCVLSSQVVPCM